MPAYRRLDRLPHIMAFRWRPYLRYANRTADAYEAGVMVLREVRTTGDECVATEVLN